MSNGQPVPLGKWQYRVLRATLPIGVLLLIAWIAWVAADLIIGTEKFGLGLAQAVLGLITSLVLIFSGYSYRRDMAAR
jgi:hypothetical protein